MQRVCTFQALIQITGCRARSPQGDASCAKEHPEALKTVKPLGPTGDGDGKAGNCDDRVLTLIIAVGHSRCLKTYSEVTPTSFEPKPMLKPIETAPSSPVAKLQKISIPMAPSTPMAISTHGSFYSYSFLDFSKRTRVDLSAAYHCPSRTAQDDLCHPYVPELTENIILRYCRASHQPWR
eukprot:Skav221770  [mRNA]  locus=scaffold490:457355:458571:- [translate_table: standard]